MPTATRTRLRIDRVLAKAPAEDRADLQGRFEDLEQACGCRMGALCMLVGTLAAVAYVAGSGSEAMPGGLLVVLALFVSAAVGKAIGLGAAQARLRWLLRTAERSSGN